ncbi:hypothetical protein PILCRDRAFT_358797 [Piloderma croceum F 1598]|uniref:Uncharacterized protein n=1 Tax=Piloderma croceum (strain F 1598) TaxID=765440 RepID=A0A0C3FMM2_PILCF|nr:hypothetical protein PILCRDRAFT_358797 [Piloderma croceum F 1598]
MDSVTDDLELTKDTMKLLHKELKTLRAQLRERNETPSETSGFELIHRERTNSAEAEVISLKLEIENLRNHNATLKDDLELLREGSNPDEKSLLLQYKVSHDKMLEQLQDAVEDKERVNREKDEKDCAQIQLHEKLSSCREKYKALKIANGELQSALDVLHHDLTEMTDQRDEAEERAKVEKMDRSHFDPEEFLNSSGATASKDQPKFNDIKPYSKYLKSSISMDVKKLCARDGLLALNQHEVIGSSTDIGTCLAIRPLHRYNPKLNIGGSGGAWERNNPGFNIGQQKSIFYKDMSWYYLGTYECVDTGTIGLSKLRGEYTLPQYGAVL